MLPVHNDLLGETLGPKHVHLQADILTLEPGECVHCQESLSRCNPSTPLTKFYSVLLLGEQCIGFDELPKAVQRRLENIKAHGVLEL